MINQKIEGVIEDLKLKDRPMKELNIKVTRSEIFDLWITECPELDIVSQGKTFTKALDEMHRVIRMEMLLKINDRKGEFTEEAIEEEIKRAFGDVYYDPSWIPTPDPNPCKSATIITASGD